MESAEIDGIYVCFVCFDRKYPINCNEWFIVEVEKEMYSIFIFLSTNILGKRGGVNFFFVFAPTDAMGDDSLASVNRKSGCVATKQAGDSVRLIANTEPAEIGASDK